MEALRDYWHAAARSADVTDDKPFAATLLGEQLVLFRSGGRVRVLQDLCIHRGTPLSLGWLEEGRVICPYHGWQYDGEGACVRIPTLEPGHPVPRKARVPAYLAEERYGLVWVCLGGRPRLPLPTFPEYDDPGFEVWLAEPGRLKANAARVIENSMDYTHFPWVHEGKLGTRDYPVYPKVTPEVDDQGGIRYTVEDPNPRFRKTRRYWLQAPFSLLLQIDDHGKDQRFTIFFACTPVTDADTIQWYCLARNWGVGTRDPIREAFDYSIIQDDWVIVQNQRPERLPLDLREELHLRGTDSAALEYRRLLTRLGVSRAV
jgi:phenylpropionate dioxygenase-like ring-hydroxylating dioxygenase large terminal subunit